MHLESTHTSVFHLEENTGKKKSPIDSADVGYILRRRHTFFFNDNI